MDNTTENSLNPMSFIKIFFRRKKLFYLPTITGLIFGICAAILLPRHYQATTTILVQEAKSDNPLFNQLAVSTTVRQRLAGIRESLLGWNSLTKLVKTLKLDEGIDNQHAYENLILSIRDDIGIHMKGNNILQLTNQGLDPDMTYKILKTMTEIFITHNVNIQSQETTDAIRFIEDQLQLYKGKIKSAEIAKLKEDLNLLLIDSTEKHPQVVRLTERITYLKNELKKENLEYTENIVLTPSSGPNPVIEEIRKALDGLDNSSHAIKAGNATQSTDYYKIMLIDKLENVLSRDAAVNEEIYGMLLQRLETAKMTQRLQASKEGTRYEVLDPPRIPISPIKPKPILVILMGLFAGIAGAVGLVISVEFFDKSFIDVEDAKNYFGIPLLGAISRINTEESLRHERESAFWYYSLITVAGAVIVMLALSAHNFMK